MMNSEINQVKNEVDEVDKNQRMAWWRAAKFGMFIHWGLYSTLAGEWKGKAIPGIGEQIMRFAEIPIKEYGKIVEDFNPTKFNAEEWVGLAHRAGMKYLAITAKHHDGFAMYHSKVSDYNVVKSTPFGKDPMKELEEACKKYGIRLCIYYSQYQDWHHPDGAVSPPIWEGKSFEERDFGKYYEEKAKPQVRELMTQYGPIGMIWFDTPGKITKEYSEKFVNIVRGYQPECIINGRIGHELGDYRQYGDNQIPSMVVDTDWETPATLNHTWGYKKNDNDWKPPKALVQLLCDIVGKGGNYLLNVGPDPEGVIPQKSIKVLEEIGKWMESYGEAIYETKPSPFLCEVPWGSVTLKPGKMFFHIFDWKQGSFVVTGICNRISRVYSLKDGGEIPFVQKQEPSADYNALILDLPAQAPDDKVSVLAVEYEGDLEVDNTPVQQPNGEVMLEACFADIKKGGEESDIQLARTGVIEKWFDCQDSLTWNFKILRSGLYQVEMVSLSEKYTKDWECGHRFSLSVADQSIEWTVEDDGRTTPRGLIYWDNIHSSCGTIRLDKVGIYTLTLEARGLKTDKGLGPKFRRLVLTHKDEEVR